MMNTSMGYQILEGRYALLDCLAVSSIGEIYRARDLERAQTHGSHSLVMVHILPEAVSEVLPIAAVFQQVSALNQHLKKPWILAPLRFGVAGRDRYLVLDHPLNSGTLQRLNAAGLSHDVVQRRASSQLGYLVSRDHLKPRTDSAFLLVGKDPAIYVLATAFLPALQALQSPRTSLTIAQRKPWLKIGMGVTAMMIALGTVTAAVLHEQFSLKQALPVLSSMKLEPSTGPTVELLAMADTKPVLLDSVVDNQIMQLGTDPKPDPILNTTLVPSTKVEPTVYPISKKSAPEANRVTMTSSKSGKSVKEVSNKAQKSVETKVEPKRELAKHAARTTEPKLEQSAIVSTKGMEPESSAKTLAQPEPVALVNLAVNVDQQPAKVVVSESHAKAVAQPESLAMIPQNTVQVMRSVPTAAIAPMKAAKIEQPPLSLDELIERADEALAKRQFSAAQRGVLYYVRAIRDIAPLHPAVDRLSREVVLYQHEQIRSMILDDDFNQAQHLLTSSANLIREFNLKELNAAQQILEHKASEIG